jgi:winged helix DNA-binding protein
VDALPPLHLGADAYLSLLARVHGFDVEDLHAMVFDQRSLRPYILGRNLRLLVPLETLSAHLRNHEFAWRSRARRSIVYRRLREEYGRRGPTVLTRLGRGPMTFGQLTAGRPLDGEIHKDNSRDWALLDYMVGSGDIEQSFSRRSLASEETYRNPPAPERVPAATSEGFGFLADLALHYFRVAGPATRDDFAWWAWISLSAARKTLEDLAGLIEELDIEGERRAHFMLEEDAAELREGRQFAGRRVALLPQRDPGLMVSPDGRVRLCDPRLRPRLAPPVRRGKRDIVAGLRPVLVGGAIVGSWQWDAAHGRVETLLEKAFADEVAEEVEGAAEALSRFLNDELPRLSRSAS